MSQAGVPPVGLYSIGIRGLDVGALLGLATANDVPFIHLRGGPRGYDLARQDNATLADWARQAGSRVPVTMVTADLDLADFLPPGQRLRRAHDELSRLAGAAAVLGARSVRLLVRESPGGRSWGALSIPGLAARHGVNILVELHHPEWFTQPGVAAVRDLLGDRVAAGVLLDTAQFQDAISGGSPVNATACLDGLIPRTRAVHLSDNGAGFAGTGHRQAARAAWSAIRSGHHAEVAFEWTGGDRSPDACFARYQAARAWWQRLGSPE